jgi:hypothetical protein
MNYQVLGLDGTNDLVTITASRGGANNANLVLTVNDPSSRLYRGTYSTGLAANIRSLTIRGANSNDTFVIQGNLGIPNITVDGGGGDNKLQINDGANTTNSLRYRITDNLVSASIINGATLWTVNYARINDGLEVDGSQAYHQFSVVDTPACATTLFTGVGPNDTTVLGTKGPLTVHGQSGIDTLVLGNSNRAAQDLGGPVNVTNSRGLTSLSINDAADPSARNNIVVRATSVTGPPCPP